MPQPRAGAHRSRRVGPPGYASLALAAYGHQSAYQVARLREADARAALQSLGPVVYAVQMGDDLIKVGYTANLARRLVSYKIRLSELHRLLMVKSGTMEDEQLLHRHFAIYTERGREYYRAVPELLEYINAVRRQMGVSSLKLPLRPL